jgi:hypothetical protein
VFKNASFQENASPAGKTLDTDVSPEPHYLPFITAAGMSFLEMHHVAETYFQDHATSPLYRAAGKDIVNFVSQVLRRRSGGFGKV